VLVNINYYQGIVTALTTFLNVGYPIKLIVKWKQKKNGFISKPIVANVPYHRTVQKEFCYPV
jgi:hypothetical protein